MSMVLWTEKGLKLFLTTQAVGLLLALISLIMVLLALAGFVAASSMGVLGGTAALGGVGILCFIMSFLCFGLIALLVLYVISLVYMFKGRNEFGPEHAFSVVTGMILLVVGFFVSLIPLIGAIGGILVALGYIFLVRKIAQERYRTFLWIYLGLVITSSILNLFAMVLGWLDRTLFANLFQGFGGILSLIGLVLLLLAYYNTWKSINLGVIKPIILDTYVQETKPNTYDFPRTDYYSPQMVYRQPLDYHPPPKNLI